MSKLKSLEKLEESFAKLPSVGAKSAERMAMAILNMDEKEVEEFCDALKEVKTNIHKCPICGNLTDKEICDVCADENRDKSIVMVVSFPKDVISLERINSYKGLYHVLDGSICLSKGQGVDSLNIESLTTRIKEGKIKEVIIATNPTIEGETTALYISKLLEGMNVEVTRIAYGLPMGGNLDYTDALTLSKAIEGRRKI